MPCYKVSINKSFQCDKAGCFCIPTEGKSCICVCENERGDIMKCDDCKCIKSDNCQCKCDDSKCTCIITKGADCICVCKDEGGKLKACDCCCTEDKEKVDKSMECKSGGCCSKKTEENATKDVGKKPKCCSKKEEKDCNSGCKCDGEKNVKSSRQASRIYECNKTECVCIPTGNQSCVCVCENARGDIVKCDDCKCNKSNKGPSTCTDSRCICIDTKGADCICVCKDGKSNFKTCDCACSDTKKKDVEKNVTKKSSGCCSNKVEQKSCCKNCDKKNTQVRQSTATSNKPKCDKIGCVCIPTEGKLCICVCNDESGNIKRCDDCKCVKSVNVQRKCDDSTCICIDAKDTNCACVCKDKKSSIQKCDCSCSENNKEGCCKKDKSVKTVVCCKTDEKALEKASGYQSCIEKQKRALDAYTCKTNEQCCKKQNITKSDDCRCVSKNEVSCYKQVNHCLCVDNTIKSCVCCY